MTGPELIKITGAVLMFAVLLSMSAQANTEVIDKRLADCLADIGRKKNWTTPEQYLSVTCHSKKIDSLAGLEVYKNITKLSLYNNRLSEVDIGPFTELKALNLARNRLTSLVIRQHDKLRKLYVFNNALSRLELENLPQLQELKASANQLESFRYRQLPRLAKVYMFDNKMEFIDIHSLPGLLYMDLRQNPMPDELYEEMDKMTGVTIVHDGNADDWD
jgi:Leucine-rich repeat (LRR) protein